MDDVVAIFLREAGLETPLLEYRVMQAWPNVAGEGVAALTRAIEVRGGVLWVGVQSPALLSDLSMRHSDLTQRLNAAVRAQVISDVKLRLEESVPAHS